MWARGAAWTIKRLGIFQGGPYRVGVLALFLLWLASTTVGGSGDAGHLDSQASGDQTPEVATKTASAPAGPLALGSQPVAAVEPPPEPAAASEPPPQPEPAPRRFSATFTGDMLLHTRVNRLAKQWGSSSDATPSEPFVISGDVDADGWSVPKPLEYDYRPMLAPIQPWIEQADWAVCHMEVPLSADNTRLEPYPTFRSPGDIADSAKALGYDSCTTASNHTLDQGPNGAVETLEVLERAGLHFTGSARSPDEAADQIWLELGGIRVAHFSYTYGFNGFRLPSDSPWMSNLIDSERILADATDAREAGAEYVIVSLHWGNEYINRPSSYQTGLGPDLLASPDIDLIIGHHAHVVQPIDEQAGEWLVYGLGNLLSNMSQLPRRDELLVTVEVTETPDGSFQTELQVLPLFLDAATMTVMPSDPQLRPSDIDQGLANQLDQSWARVTSVLEAGSGWDHLTFAGRSDSDQELSPIEPS